MSALILSVRRHLRPEEVRFILRESAIDLGDSMRDDIYGYGLVNANQAVDFVSLDSDNDDICIWHTDPKDTDNDGYDDFDETISGSDPTDPNSIPSSGGG